jgi:hypothetical protein
VPLFHDGTGGSSFGYWGLVLGAGLEAAVWVAGGVVSTADAWDRFATEGALPGLVEPVVPVAGGATVPPVPAHAATSKPRASAGTKEYVDAFTPTSSTPSVSPLDGLRQGL